MTDEYTRTVVLGNGPAAELGRVPAHKPSPAGAGDNTSTDTSTVDQAGNDLPPNYPAFEDTSWLT